MNVEFKKIWDQSKDKLPLHQRIMSETLFKAAGSYDICWVCGDDEQLSIVKVKNDDSETIGGIICDDCFAIQENQGTLFVERNPIKR